jgi:hypothetical protein
MKKQLLKIMALLLLSGSIISCSEDTPAAANKQLITLRADGVLFSVTTGGTDVEEADAHIRDGNKL